MNISKILIVILFPFLLTNLSACSSILLNPAMEEAQSEAAKVIIHCHAQRSQMCTREYMPVCGVKEPGVTCKEGQCEEKSVTYPNGCAACADVSVSSYKKGACEDLNVDSNNTK